MSPQTGLSRITCGSMSPEPQITRADYNTCTCQTDSSVSTDNQPAILFILRGQPVADCTQSCTTNRYICLDH